MHCHYVVATVPGVSDGLRFEWDARKAVANLRKHGVSFEEAETVFSDDEALMIDDPDHLDDEKRFVLLGIGAAMRTLVVCHCYKDAANTIRIISARKANAKERRKYMSRWRA